MQRRHLLTTIAMTMTTLTLPTGAPAQASAAPAHAQDLPLKPVLTFALVKRLLQAGETEAVARQLAVSIVIADDGGHPWALLRLEGAAPATAAIAGEKARTAALIRRPGKAFEDLINGGRTALLSIGSLQGMLDGGTPLMLNGHCLGAVGVSGGRPADDNAVVDAVLRQLAG